MTADLQRSVPATELEITVGATLEGAEAMDFRFWSGAMLKVPAAYATAAAFTVYVGATAAGTFYEWLPSSSNETNPVTVAPGKATDMPGGCFPSKFCKFVNAAGAGTILVDPKG